MILEFSKCHGAGNDFIVVDNRGLKWSPSGNDIRNICHRQRGVGADGLILLDDVDGGAVRMDFFNSDGSRAGMCGNGLRCAALFAYRRMNRSELMSFDTDAGRLGAEIAADESVRIDLPLKSAPEKIDLDGVGPVFFCDTGVPHAVVVMADIVAVDLMRLGGLIRHHDRFAPTGTNVNLVAPGMPNLIRTYERGVEGETLACGTGIGAAAVCLAAFEGGKTPLEFATVAGDRLSVDFRCDDGRISDISLTGPAVEVFTGEIEIKSA